MTRGRKALYILVIAIGGLRMVGWMAGSETLRGIGAITAAAPLPIVFTEVKGVETFASDVHLAFTVNGRDSSIRITPAVYRRTEGPYNRRNVYGAAIAYGPVMEEALWQSVLSHAWCTGMLEREFGVPANSTAVRFVLNTRTAGRDDEWTLQPRPCP